MLVVFGFNKYANIILFTQMKINKLIRKNDKNLQFFNIKHLTKKLFKKNSVKTYKVAFYKQNNVYFKL